MVALTHRFTRKHPTGRALSKSVTQSMQTGRMAGHIFVAPDLHYTVLSTADKRHKLHPGDHGWDPEHREMHGVFMAGGPRLRAGQEIGEISAVDVYPLMLELLQIAAHDKSDYVLRGIIAADE